jgi:hypothetical protein
VHAASSPLRARQFVAAELDELLVPLTALQQRDTLYAAIVRRLQLEPIAPRAVTRKSSPPIRRCSAGLSSVATPRSSITSWGVPGPSTRCPRGRSIGCPCSAASRDGLRPGSRAASLWRPTARASCVVSLTVRLPGPRRF